MGGYGSGRRYGSKNTTDEFIELDVRRLHRRSLLKPGTSCTLTWSLRGTKTAAIEIIARPDSVVLSYKHYRRSSDEWVSQYYPVHLTWTRCNYGGLRPWFICPARGCGHRVAVLYGGEIFACRHCYGLAYESQREPAYYRALSRAQGIRKRLGGTANRLEPFPDKPKGMHWRTYERLQAKHDGANRKSTIGMAMKLRMIGMVDFNGTRNKLGGYRRGQKRE